MKREQKQRDLAAHDRACLNAAMAKRGMYLLRDRPAEPTPLSHGWPAEDESIGVSQNPDQDRGQRLASGQDDFRSMPTVS